MPDHKNEPAAYSITAFCEAHGIGRSFFYLLRKDGLAPRVMKVGRRRLISKEEAARWRASMTENQRSEEIITGGV